MIQRFSKYLVHVIRNDIYGNARMREVHLEALAEKLTAYIVSSGHEKRTNNKTFLRWYTLNLMGVKCHMGYDNLWPGFMWDG
jgi:hypothetical protein